MIFLTVGTQFPFDRLVKCVDDAVSQDGFKEEIFAQIGKTSYRPRNFEVVSSLEKRLFDKCIRQASGIISHAGMGTIIMALDSNKPLLVMPRLSKYGEVVNDHQVAIARKFEELGHILVAYDVEELPDRIHELKNFTPRKRKASPHAVADRIRHFLSNLGEPRHA
ncbi:MAG: PssE/Cps14G family polysaccharide biosynthesis glycosyltransferase [Planctomycetota bacterium]|jgi:UDP-N-acetylglucosamine transferase subunit ALG13